MSTGDPQPDIVPSRPGLNWCTSVPTDCDSESRLSRFRSDRCFSQDVAPSPWSCGSSTLELSHMGSNMRAGTCSTSPDPDPGSPLSEDVFLDAVSVTQEYGTSDFGNYVCQEYSTSDLGNKRTSEATTHNKAAGDALPRVGMSTERELSDTATHGKRSAVNGAGDPKSNIFASPIPLLQRCASVPTDGDRGGFSSFRSLSERRFSQDAAPSPWCCGSSIRELSRRESNVMAETYSPSSESFAEQGCLTFKREVLLSFSVSPLTREPPQDWSYLSKVFPEVCLTKVDNYFDVSAYSLPIYHSSRKDEYSWPIYHSREDADDSWKAVVRTSKLSEEALQNKTMISRQKLSAVGFQDLRNRTFDVSSAVVKGAFPDFIKQEPDISPTVINGFPGVSNQGIDVSTRVE